MNEKDLVLEFESSIKPTLSNHMYRAVSAKSSKRKSGYWAVLARTDGLKWYQGVMAEELKTTLPPEKVERFKYLFDTGVYDIEVSTTHYVYYKDYYEFDASNLIKAHEDCVAKHLGIDDSKTCSYFVKKVPTEFKDVWKAVTVMKLVPKHPLLHM